MRKLVYLLAIICLTTLHVSAIPMPDENAEHQTYYLDEPQKENSVYDEDTPKFEYQPIKEGEKQIPDANLEDGMNPEGYSAEDELPIMSEEEAIQAPKIDNRNKRTKAPKQLKRKVEDEILQDPELNKMPDNGMSSPEQKTYSQNDYEQAYRDMQVPTFSYVHGIDPDQYYDMKDTMWSPYPLFRLNSPLYFKTMVIPPGYYLLTPRQYKSKWYVLFKEAGTVRYAVPVFSQSYVEAGYYHTHLKELDMCKSARWQIKFLNALGKYCRKSKRRPATQTNVELTDLDNNFILIDLYYGFYKYSMIFRTEKF